MTLPFPGLIMSILHQKRVKIPSGLPVIKREDPIFAQTMTRSRAWLRGLEEEGAPSEDTAHEGGNTNDEIDNFTLGPEDMDASPT